MFPELPRIERPFRNKLLKRPLYPVWTENKARLIDRYLYYFKMITHHGTYIDGFAGPQDPDKPHTWSAKLVLENEPKWFRYFYLCEKDPNQFKQLESLKQIHSDRNIELFNKDFNEAVHDVLAAGRITPKEAAFCLLDQRTFECKWATLQTLATHKKSGLKIELFYFLAQKWFHRAISAHKDDKPIREWWGNDQWRSELPLTTSEVAEVFCSRIRTELGYRSALAWPIYERQDGGPVMYSMIHATDH